MSPRAVVSPPHLDGARVDFILWLGHFGLGRLRDDPLRCTPPRVCDGGAGACVICLCVCIPACAGAVPPPWAAATTTQRAACESPASRANALTCSFAWAHVDLGTEVECALPSTGQSPTPSPPRVCDGGAGVCVVCLGLRLPACVCTVAPPSAVAYPTGRVPSESPASWSSV